MRYAKRATSATVQITFGEVRSLPKQHRRLQEVSDRRAIAGLEGIKGEHKFLVAGKAIRDRATCSRPTSLDRGETIYWLTVMKCKFPPTLSVTRRPDRVNKSLYEARLAVVEDCNLLI